jgi:hypothetical protein
VVDHLPQKHRIAGAAEDDVNPSEFDASVSLHQFNSSHAPEGYTPQISAVAEHCRTVIWVDYTISEK